LSSLDRVCIPCSAVTNDDALTYFLCARQNKLKVDSTKNAKHNSDRD